RAMLSTRHASPPTPPARGPLAALARWDAAGATRAALVLTALVYLLILVPPLALAGFNPLVFAHVGREGPGQRFWDQSPPLVDGYGYDGQFYYYLARDPLLRGGAPTYLDAPGYRYQRILLPALSALLALGQPAWIGWTLLLTNLLGLALGIWAGLRIVDHFRGSGRLGTPLGGVVFVLGLLVRTLASDVLPTTTKALAATFGLVVVLMLAVAVAALWGIRYRSAFGWQMALQGVFLLTLTHDVWG